MKWSEAQLEVWRVRDELSRETAGMSPKQLRSFLRKAVEEFEEATGTKLEVVDRTRGRSLPAPGQ